LKTAKAIISFLFIGLTAPIQAQQVLFYNHIAPVIYKCCMPCHLQGAAAPFALETYDDVKHHAKMIAYVVGEHIMPPWKADMTYTHFHNERKIDSGFITLFQKWMAQDFPQGNHAADTLIRLAYEKAEKPDFIVKMAQPYKLEALNTDVFISFMDSIFLGEDRYIRQIIVIPGNRKLVHHCRVDFDTTDRCVKFINADGFIHTAELTPLGPPPFAFVADYVPGETPFKYPPIIGYKVPKKLYVSVNVHYAPCARVEYDSTKVFIYLYPKGSKLRELKHWAVMINPTNRGVEISKIPHDSITTVAISSLPTDTALSIIGIEPHMHLLGQTYKAFAVTPANDTVPLIRINDWNFNWQETYHYNKPVVLPKGSVIFGIATFDNTSSNPNNPFYPPRDVFFNDQMRTTNEMFEINLQSIIYRPGDEKLNLYGDDE
jgi:Copper type II ascorbate-dependent monooxygenase, C-terminal domain